MIRKVILLKINLDTNKRYHNVNIILINLYSRFCTFGGLWRRKRSDRLIENVVISEWSSWNGNEVGIGVIKGGKELEVSKTFVSIVDERTNEIWTNKVITFEVPWASWVDILSPMLKFASVLDIYSQGCLKLKPPPKWIQQSRLPVVWHWSAQGWTEVNQSQCCHCKVEIDHYNLLIQFQP